MKIDQNDLWEAQCFFRQLAPKRYNQDHLNGLTQEQKDFYERITFYYGQAPQEIKEITTNILAQIQKLTIRLIPLYQIGFRYNVYLAGGSIRDLLYGNATKIKDLDIVFSINEDSLNSVFKETPLMTHEAILGKRLHDHIDWRNDSQAKKIHGLFSLCLSNNYEILRSITSEDIKIKAEKNNYEPILNKQLDSILTVKEDSDDYPMDILLTTSNMEQYLNTFNFEICKAHVLVFHHRGSGILTNPVEMLERIIVTPGFLSDGMDKTITMNMATQKTIANVEHSIKKHLPRIFEKYPNHKLILNPGKNPEFENWKKKYENYIALNNSLPIKSPNENEQASAIIKI